MQRDLPLWRTLLFVPVNVPKFVERAPRSGADGLLLDLEDSIGPADKETARAMLPAIAKQLNADGTDVVVRINRPWRHAVRDLEAVVSPHVTAILCPKCDSAAHVKALSEILGELEMERGLPIGHTRMLLIVETAEGFEARSEIAKADPRIVSISLGSEDFGLSMGMVADEETLLVPKQLMVATARAAGIRPMGFIGSIAEYRDVEKLRQIVRKSRRFGFEGASCIHPNQVRVCNEEFAPTAEEVASARRLIAAYDEALAQGRGSVEIDGKMVDIPIAIRAKNLLHLHDMIQARAARTAARAR
jgi:citrate lyase subunit beta / citryl-CoA lyase